MKVETIAPQRVAAWKLLLALGLFLIGFIALAHRLWVVQVVEGGEYSGAQSAQSYRRVETPGLRGRIFDRNGILLAENRPVYSVAIYCEELRQPGKWDNTIAAVNRCIDDLSLRLGLPREVTLKDVRRHVYQALPMPFQVFHDVDFRTVAYITEHAAELPGVVIQSFARRVYPHGSLAAHVLGYVGYASERRQDEIRWHYRLPEVVGRSGIEARYDDLLSGESGESLLRVDSRGYAHERWVARKQRAGSDLMLTLDIRLQQTAERALANRAGAVVALDPRNGDVLVMASAPAYDPNGMVPPVASAFYKQLLQDEQRPLFNRALQGIYPPGSVFKPFVAIAAQEYNYNAATLHECSGIYAEYGCKLRCANRYGHGELDMREALMKSCNPYFCALGTKIGMDAIAATAEQAGFGSRTGIDLPGEAKGLMPTPTWKEASGRGKWRVSDTAQSSIGQGMILATPLQLAHATGALAMEGDMRRPRLVAVGTQGELQRHLPWTHDAIRAVIDGMEMVVAGGTGQTMRLEGVEVAGKTGTAEFIDSKTRSRKKRVWCTAFAPAETPEIVVVAMLEDGVGGGRDAGPIVQKVLAEYFNTKAHSNDDINPYTLED